MYDGLKNKKINLHVTEQCNYNCKYCFSHNCGSGQLLNIDKWKTIVDNCIDVLSPIGFNIAGGEPLLYKDLSELIKYIKSKGLYCSIITNGSLLTKEWIDENVKYLDCVGISIDSFNKDTLIRLGCDYKGDTLTCYKFKEICDYIKQVNPRCKIKVNTVVCSLNKTENLFEVLKNIPYELKWKILNMKLFVDKFFSNEPLQVDASEYKSFVKNNLNLDLVDFEYSVKITKENVQTVVEPNMIGGYLIVMPHGYLVDNNKNDVCHSIASCIDKKELKQKTKNLMFNEKLYNSRY